MESFQKQEVFESRHGGFFELPENEYLEKICWSNERLRRLSYDSLSNVRAIAAQITMACKQHLGPAHCARDPAIAVLSFTLDGAKLTSFKHQQIKASWSIGEQN